MLLGNGTPVYRVFLVSLYTHTNVATLTLPFVRSVQNNINDFSREASVSSLLDLFIQEDGGDVRKRGGHQIAGFGMVAALL